MALRPAHAEPGDLRTLTAVINASAQRAELALYGRSKIRSLPFGRISLVRHALLARDVLARSLAVGDGRSHQLSALTL